IFSPNEISGVRRACMWSAGMSVHERTPPAVPRSRAPESSPAPRVSAVEVLEQEIEREHVARPVAVAPEHDVRPAPRSRRRVPVPVEAKFSTSNGADEESLVARTRERTDGECVLPGTKPADVVVGWW